MSGLPSGEIVSSVSPIDLQLGRLNDEQKSSVFGRLGFDEARLRELYRVFSTGVTDPRTASREYNTLESQLAVLGFIAVSERIRTDTLMGRQVEDYLGAAEVYVGDTKKSLSLSLNPFVDRGKLRSLTVKVGDDKGKNAVVKLGREQKTRPAVTRVSAPKVKTIYKAEFIRGDTSLVPGLSRFSRAETPLQPEQTRFITELALECLAQNSQAPQSS